MIKMSEYAKRRNQLMKKIGPKSIAILPAAPQAHRNGDYHYPYRQQSDFYYLTGFQEPESVAIIAPKRGKGEFVLFNRPKNREQEIWEGLRAGQNGACDTFGADESFPIEDLEKKLPELLEGREEIHYAFGLNPEFDEIIWYSVNKIRGKIRSGLQSPFIFIDTAQTIHEMRLIKSPAEIAVMRRAAEISAAAHTRAIQYCRPGLNEYELEAEVLYEFNRNGAKAEAYTSIVGAGKNSCILHYTNNNHLIQNKDIVLIDAGCEYEYYASDITRTFPANGRFTPEQRMIYDLVLEAQLAGIKAVRPGVPWNDIQKVIVKILTQGLVDMGLLKGKINDLIENQDYFKFYMHKSGHWLGLDVHDVGRYKINDKWRNLQPGMVLTVEPGLYISSDITGVPKRWHNIGVRIEDDVLVTKQGCEVLSAGVPKNLDDIEGLMQ